MTEPVTVTHALGSYPVYVEAGALARLPAIASHHLAGLRSAMIADDTVYQLYLERKLGPGDQWRGEALTFPAGEASKSREWWARLTDGLLERGYGRDSGIIALGGGVAGDLAGFVAATYMRGVPCIQVPTTLLAMLDASVGGKTGVDAPQGKNLIGAFHPPVAVVADPAVLGTLPEREFRSGLAEAVKHGLIADRDYFDWIGREADPLGRRDLATLTRLVRRSVEIKAEVVGADEREDGRRAILNAGHTVAHALERVTDYRLSHGEAVALGLVAECELARLLGMASAEVRTAVEALLQRLGLPLRYAGTLSPGQVTEAMRSDKKNRNARIRFALPRAVGEMHSAEGWTADAPESRIREALAAII
ncbi:MAG: 3-dehydroquinate synthase [Gemmatimonadales bacterium]|nr:3-dehydroquinate synthase [Gemmatimonadales bacterium]